MSKTIKRNEKRREERNLFISRSYLKKNNVKISTTTTTAQRRRLQNHEITTTTTTSLWIKTHTHKKLINLTLQTNSKIYTILQVYWYSNYCDIFIFMSSRRTKNKTKRNEHRKRENFRGFLLPEMICMGLISLSIYFSQLLI